MRQTIVFTSLLLFSTISSGQLVKNLESKFSGETNDPINEYPKGLTAYSTTHTDESNISGVYFAKYPIQFLYKTTMGTYKTFTVDQIVIEFDPTTFAGRIHVVDDAITKMVRNAGSELSSMWDFYGGGLENVQKNVARDYKLFTFDVNCRNYVFGSIMGVSKKGALTDGTMYRYLQDPDILLFGKMFSEGRVSEYDSQYAYGGNLNVFSKDKSKLADWDSTKLINTMIEYQKLNNEYVSKSFGDMVVLPKQVLNDDDREAEYFNIIKPMAAQDKPVAWGDKFIYCYISTDWKDEYKNQVKTHRWCTVIAVSNGWTEGSEARYIPVIIKQNWDGSAYGKTYMAGFQGALVPISSETAMSFTH